MVSGGKIAEIEHDAGDCSAGCIGIHAAVTVQNQTGIVRSVLGKQKFPGGVQSGLLNIKGKHLAGGAGKAAEQQRVVAVSHSGIDAEVAGRNMFPDEVAAPFGNLICFHWYPFWSDVLSGEGKTDLSMLQNCNKNVVLL